METELSEQTRGWLRFVYQKATTPDDWSSRGVPHEWWDRKSTAPMCSFPRFDLGETSYILPIVADITPAWREVYTRIADELVGRHTTFWAAIDWLTMIGEDPDRQNYPPEWQIFLPDRLRGNYEAPGWVANGVAPWGLQPDPIGSDGNLFFRGFFNLLLSVYKCISGDGKWDQPFAVTGYQNRRFDWTHTQIAQFLHDQWRQQPQGPHCENTKIWPFCLSAAGLGLQLFDRISGTQLHGVYPEWVEYAKKNYMVTNSDGDITMFPFCYDPLEDEIVGFPDPFVAFATLSITPYLAPQDPVFGSYLYEQASEKLGWRDPSKPVFDIAPDPRLMIIGLLLARNFGDSTTEKRLAESLSEIAEPRWFGDEQRQFGYWFGIPEDWPRGQLSALYMLCETGAPDAWLRAFSTPNQEKFDQPTVTDIDYPAVDVLQAVNDENGVLHVAITPGLPSQKGCKTQFKVTQLPNAEKALIYCDDQPFHQWRVLSDDSIEISTENERRQFRIVSPRNSLSDDIGSQVFQSINHTPSDTVAVSSYLPEAPKICACC